MIKSALSNQRKRIKVGCFFTHPTQHHSIMFKQLSTDRRLDVQIYYYDKGLLGNMFDEGYQTSDRWDVDLLDGTRHHFLHNWLRGRHIHPFRQLNPGIISILLRERFDAVWFFGYASPSNWLGILFSKVTGSLVFYQSDTNALDEDRKRRSRIKEWMRRYFLSRADVYLAIGDKNYESFIQASCDPSKIYWCPFPVDVSRYQRATEDSELELKLRKLRIHYSIPQDARIVAFCGKLIERKRPRDFIEAVKTLNCKNVYGLLIGSGEMQKELESSISSNDRIRITGFVNQSMIPYHMLLADIAVVSSEWDPHPLVTTEFSACGAPVLASHWCGVWGSHDILRPGENGFIYECGNTRELVQLLNRLLDDRSLLRMMSERSKELAIKQSAEYAASQLSKLISDKFDERQTVTKP